MNQAAHFHVHGPNVAHETFDDEVVIVNLETGRYFCLQRTAALVWNHLLQGASVGDIVAFLSQRHTAAPGEIERAVEGLIDSLVADRLLARAESPAPDSPALPVVTACDLTPFELPPLQTFTDMQDLLLLDPIHEVDSAGWPVAAPRNDTARRA